MKQGKKYPATNDGKNEIQNRERVEQRKKIYILQRMTRRMKLRTKRELKKEKRVTNNEKTHGNRRQNEKK